MPDTDRPLEGQVALVTGAGRGIGREIALALAAEGMRVGLVGRTRGTLDATLTGCATLGVKAVAVPADVTVSTQVRGAVSTIERDLGPIDLLVSNAGARDRAKAKPWEADESDWWRVVETNLRGPYLLASAALPAMVARGSGRVLHVGSGMGLRPQPDWSGYAVSKTALVRLTETLAAALDSTGVTVLEFSPGLVRTDMTETMWGPPEEQSWNAVADMTGAVVRFARGDLDALHGRFVHAARDDLDALVAQADAMRANDARTLRLRPYATDDPLA